MQYFISWLHEMTFVLAVPALLKTVEENYSIFVENLENIDRCSEVISQILVPKETPNFSLKRNEGTLHVAEMQRPHSARKAPVGTLLDFHLKQEARSNPAHPNGRRECLHGSCSTQRTRPARITFTTRRCQGASLSEPKHPADLVFNENARGKESCRGPVL